MLYGRLYPRDDQEAFPLSGGIVNGTCTKERSTEKGPPLFQNGSLAFEAHDVCEPLLGRRLAADALLNRLAG
jgi:hypothetical protein